MTGGGSRRRRNGVTAVKAMRRAQAFYKFDERIFGCGQYIEEMLAEARGQMETAMHSKRSFRRNPQNTAGQENLPAPR